VTDTAIVIPYFNPAGYRSHVLKLQRSLEAYAAAGLAEHVHLAGAGPRPPVAANIAFWDDECPFLWHKERLVNLAAARLPTRYRRVAWMDSDVVVGDDWLGALDDALRDNGIVQAFRRARYRHLGVDLGGAPDGRGRSRVRVNSMGIGKSPAVGLAWAADRALFDDGPGLFDLGIVGGGDSVFALGMLRHTATPSLHWLPIHHDRLVAWWSPAMVEVLDDWLVRARAWHGSATVGFAQADVDVIEHGTVAARSYNNRHLLLGAVSPGRDLRAGDDTVYRWSDEGLRHAEPAVRAYFFDRREDEGLVVDEAA
jgi:hypothetical protein